MTKKAVKNQEMMSLVGRSHLTWKRYLEEGLSGENINLKQFFLLGQLTGGTTYILPKSPRCFFATARR